MSTKYATPLKFHKKVAQLQIDLAKPKEEEGKTKEGCLFISLAKALDDNTGRMDWDNKINMKLGPMDISRIITGVRSGQPVKLFHKSEAAGSTTTLEVAAGERKGTFKWFLNKTQGQDKKFGNIYLDQRDMFHIFIMFEAALPIISGWTA